jgi:hypothetical protein
VEEPFFATKDVTHGTGLGSRRYSEMSGRAVASGRRRLFVGPIKRERAAVSSIFVADVIRFHR